MSKPIPFEDLPLSRFHIRTVFSGTGGQFSDGFVLGIIGIAVSMAAGPLQLTVLWMGLLGAASLAGLFLGSLAGGPLADKYGRRTVFAWDMLLFALISASQFFVSSPEQLFVLRLLLGLVLGFDYVVSKSLVTEFAPRRYRGRLLSILAAAWAGGYVAAYLVGFAVRDVGPDAWRIMLALSGVPALLIFPLRLGVPESPIWLMARGRTQEAMDIVQRKFGPNVSLPEAAGHVQKKGGHWAALFSKRWRKNTWVGCVFYTCQVIPFFALGTFSPKVLEALNVQDKFVGGLVYNVLLLSGAVLGLMFIDRISRRTFLVGTFYLSAVGLGVLAYAGFGPVGTILAFGFFACVLAAAVNLEFVYPPELFPTHLRASGIGLAVASSRFGSAFATFLLPIAVQSLGIQTALGVCVGVLIFGGVICHLFAPETSKQDLSGVIPDPVYPDASRATLSAPAPVNDDREGDGRQSSFCDRIEHRPMSANKLIDMHAVQVFIAVAEEGSMSGAAARMGISQSGVSQMIRQLEEELGVVLVDRTTRPLALTPFGVALRNRGSVLSEEISHLKAQVVNAGRGVKPDLRIGLVDSFAATCGSIFTRQLLSKVAQLSIRTGLSPQQGEALLRRDLDLIVTSDPLMDANNVIRYRLFSEKYFVITPKDPQRSIDSLEDIRRMANVLPVVRFNHGSQVGLQIERHLRSLNIRVPNRLELDNADALTSMVAEGIGWAVTSPMCFLQARAWTDKVNVHLTPELGLERSLYLVARRDEYSAFFAHACETARGVILDSFLPRLQSMGHGVETLINADEGNTLEYF